MFIYELPNWPRFTWDVTRLAGPLAAIRHKQGRLIGNMEALGFNFRQEAVLRTLTADVLKTSEIEGEKLDAELKAAGSKAHYDQAVPSRTRDGHWEIIFQSTDPQPEPTHGEDTPGDGADWWKSD